MAGGSGVKRQREIEEAKDKFRTQLEKAGIEACNNTDQIIAVRITEACLLRVLICLNDRVELLTARMQHLHEGTDPQRFTKMMRMSEDRAFTRENLQEIAKGIQRPIS